MTLKERKMTMEKRIEAFFRQSGGPQNSKIEKLLDEHLRYGKDHGMPGRKETFEDAVIWTVMNDPSLLLLFERIQKWRTGRLKKQQQLLQLEEKLENLKRKLKN
jgi:hypothetical protein